MKYMHISLMFAICSAALLGDYIVFESSHSSSQIFRAFADTLVHGAIGMFSSLLFFSYGVHVTTQAWIYNVGLCTLTSSLIDVDHFIVAKSIYLKDLTNLKERGIFHNTSFWIFLTSILLAYSLRYRKLNIYILTYMLIIAFTSHHIRDANRRGIWFYPYGHTPALSRYVYIFLVCVLPSILSYTFIHTKPVAKNTVVLYRVV